MELVCTYHLFIYNHKKFNTILWSNKKFKNQTEILLNISHFDEFKPTFKTSREKSSLLLTSISMCNPFFSIPPPDLTSFVRFPQTSQFVAIMTTSLKWGISGQVKEQETVLHLFYRINLKDTGNFHIGLARGATIVAVGRKLENLVL